MDLVEVEVLAQQALSLLLLQIKPATGVLLHLMWRTTRVNLQAVQGSPLLLCSTHFELQTCCQT